MPLYEVRSIVNRRLIAGDLAVIDNSVTQIVTINGSPTGGTFTLFITGASATVAWNATATTVQAGVRALGGNYSAVTVTGNAGGPYTITYPNGNITLVDASSALTGGSSPSVTLVPDPTPPAAGGAPPMPTTSKDSTWRLQWSQDFNTDVAEGSFLASTSPYRFNTTAGQGNATTNDQGKGKFTAYLWPGTPDTRLQQAQIVTIVTQAGSPDVTITSAGANVARLHRGFMPRFAAAGTIPPFPTNSRVLNTPAPTATSFRMNANATASGTFTGVRVYEDGGFYDERRFSVKGGICTLRMDTDPTDDKHHVGTLIPALGGWNGNAVRTDSGLAGEGYSGRAVLGGRFNFCVRVPTAIPTYKVALLLYPYNNNAMPIYNGEFDWPECNLNSIVSFFMHTPARDGTRNGQRGGTISPSLTIADNQWHIYTLEWRPNQADNTQSTARIFLDGTEITAFGYGPGTTHPTEGIKVPYMPMMWKWQCETSLSYDTPMDDTAAGTVQWAWGTYEEMV